MSFADDIVLYIENPKDPTRKMWEIKNKFTKVTGYKINIQKAVTLLYINNELSETELRKQSFTIQFSSDLREFYFFSCLIAVDSTFSTMLNKSGKGGPPCSWF